MNREMTKTTEEITKLRDIIQAELDRLPSHDIFGGSNEQDIHDGEGHIQDLNRVLEGKKSIGEEVASWIDGDDLYLLSDYVG